MIPLHTFNKSAYNLMNLQQSTDRQLIDRLNSYGEEILSTSTNDHCFKLLCSKYDAVQEELEARGIWR